MDQNIYNRIIKPISTALNGWTPSAPLEWCKGSVQTYAWFVRDQQGRAGELFEALLPFYEEYLFHPEKRMFNRYANITSESREWQYKATECVHELLNKDKARWPKLFSNHDLFDFALKCAELESIQKYSRNHFLSYYVSVAVENGFETDWDTLLAKVLPELMNAPKDYNKLLVDQCCMLWGIILIAKSTVGNAEKRSQLIKTLEDKWQILQDLYSLLTGLIIKGYVSYTAVVAPYAAHKNEYAHLFYDMLEHRSDLADYVPEAKRNEFVKKRNAIDIACHSIEQRHDLDELVQIIFPDVVWTYFDYHHERVSMAETLKKIEEQDIQIKEKDEQICHWRGMAESLSETIKEMKQCCRDNALTVEEISELILSFDVGTDLLVYHLFDDELEDNDAWQNGRRSLLKRIKQKKEEEKNRAQATTVNVAAGGINVQQANSVGK